MAQIKGSLEENVLALLSWSDQYAPIIAANPSLSAKIFSTKQWQRVAEVALVHIEKYKCAPKIHLDDLLEAELREEKDNLLAFTLDSMKKVYEQIQPDFVLDKLGHFIETQGLFKALDSATQALRKDDLPSVYSALTEIRPPQPDNQGIWLADPVQALRFMKHDTDLDYFPSGIPEFDRLGIRPERKTLTILLAETNMGKSWWAVQLGKHALMHRKQVLHITLEMREEKVAQRYIQCLFGMSRSKAETVQTGLFIKDDLGYYLGYDPKVEVVQPATEENKNVIVNKMRVLEHRKLLIREFPPGTLTVGQLRSYILSLGKMHNFVPDLLIVDFGDKMSIGKEYRIDIGRNFTGLSALASEFNMAVASPTQGNRKSVGKKWVTREHTGEDFSKVQGADTVITYSQTPREQAASMARLFVDKARDVQKGYRVWISQSYEIGQFCIDSALMNEKATKELKRMSGEEE